ncbi:hypothetical protein K439DRAFT_1630473, partial [Ramaria rubella]
MLTLTFWVNTYHLTCSPLYASGSGTVLASFAILMSFTPDASRNAKREYLMLQDRAL